MSSLQNRREKDRTAMKTLQTLYPLALALPLLAFQPAPEGLTFGPEKDTSVSKSFSMKADFTVEDLYVSFGGQEMPPEAMGMEEEQMNAAADMQVSVTEKYVKSADGKPVQLLRTFDELFLELSGGGETEEVDEFAELEGETVEFSWNEEDEEFAVAFHESEGDEELLAPLNNDMDLRVLLPDGSVDTGDTWQISSKELYPFFFPGGLARIPSGDDGLPADIEEALWGQLESLAESFKVRCTYKGSRDAGGTEVGEIFVEMSGTASVDMGDLITTIAEQSGEMPEGEIAADMEIELKGEATLLWNLAGGHVHSFEMNAETNIAVDVEVSMDVEGQQFEIAVQAELAGNAEWELTTE